VVEIRRTEKGKMRFSKRAIGLILILLVFLFIPGPIWKNPTNIMRFVYVAVLLAIWSRVPD